MAGTCALATCKNNLVVATFFNFPLALSTHVTNPNTNVTYNNNNNGYSTEKCSFIM